MAQATQRRRAQQLLQVESALRCIECLQQLEKFTEIARIKPHMNTNTGKIAN